MHSGRPAWRRRHGGGSAGGPRRRPRARTVASEFTASRCWPARSASCRVTVRFWDDSTVVARGNPDAPVVLIRDERAIAHFLRAPNQLGLGRAWVSGALDVDGDLERVLGLRHRVSDLSLGATGRARLAAAALRVAGPRALRRPPIPECEAEPAGRLHSLRRDQASVRHHYDVSNRFYELLLGPTWSTPAPTSPTRTIARARAGAQARADLPQAAPAARASGCSTSAAAGAR